jgi:hypothetical protein
MLSITEGTVRYMNSFQMHKRSILEIIKKLRLVIEFLVLSMSLRV